jgi:ABC-type nickel/cobalt efflux system permease component RcnA
MNKLGTYIILVLVFVVALLGYQYKLIDRQFFWQVSALLLFLAVGLWLFYRMQE